MTKNFNMRWSNLKPLPKIVFDYSAVMAQRSTTYL